MIRVFTNKSEISDFIASLDGRAPSEDTAVLERVREIIAQVRQHGRNAVLQMREKFESIAPSVPLTVGKSALETLAEQCPEQTRRVLHESISRVRTYHNIQRDETRWLSVNESEFGSRLQPLDSVALYVPGGKAFYPSSLIMSAVPAQVAGVKRLAIFTPARSLNDSVFAATVCALGIDEIHAVGGAQAVAMATFGVEGVERCDKIVGPGNVYVATAKQCLAGRIGIDGFAGPSEILVLSDGSSPAEWIALDMLAQAEHDEDASAVLITTSPDEAKEVAIALEKLVPDICRDRAEIARASLSRWGAICVVDSREMLLEIANKLNAEHLHIQTRCALDPHEQDFWLHGLKGVGAIFLGCWSAESFGDYLAGPSHVLPTAGTARFSSPLGVYDFVRRSSVLKMSKLDAQLLSEATAVFAEAEQLWAHAAAARARAEKLEMLSRQGVKE